MSSEKFCLRWNDFESHISGSFKEIRDAKDFFDVTLVCEEEQIQLFPKTKTSNELEQKSPPAENQTNETLYLCNFRVSVDGDWLCLKELEEDTHQVDKNKEITNDIAVKRHAQHMTSSFLTPTLDKSINYPNYPTSKKGAIE